MEESNPIRTDPKTGLLFCSGFQWNAITTTKHGSCSTLEFFRPHSPISNLLQEKFQTDCFYGLAARHGENIIQIIGKKNQGRFEGDALVLRRTPMQKHNQVIFSTTADCPTLLLHYGGHGYSIGAVVHSGWKSTRLEIVKKAIRQMLRLGAEFNSIKIFLWPGICGQHYEVGEDVKKNFAEIHGSKYERYFRANGHPGKFNLSLEKIILNQLWQLGYNRRDNLLIAPICSKEDERFSSVRRDGPGQKARNALFLQV